MTVKEMRERRGKCAHDMAELANNLTPENKVKFDGLDAEQEGLKTQIEAIERAAALETETRGTQRPPENQIGDPSNDPAKKAEKLSRAFKNYLKNGLFPDNYGFRGLDPEERELMNARKVMVQVESRDMSEGIPTGGAYPGSTTGFFVPVGFVNRIEEGLKYYGPMWNSSEVFDTATGQPLPFPTDNDTAISGEIVGEGAQVSTQDVTISQVNFSAYKFSTKLVKVSIELLQDSAFDLESWLVKKFGIRLGRISNTKFTVGAGPSHQAGSPLVAAPEPSGIVGAASAGVTSGTTPAIIGDDNQTTPDPTQQIGYIDLVNLEHSLDILYRVGASYMMHDGTLRYVKTLKDKFGHPLWMASMAAGKPDTILGYKYWINNDMAQLGAGNKSVLFGQMDKYLIRRVRDMSILRLVERFADLGQVAFLGFARYDGNLLDAGTHPVVYLQNHA